VEETEETKETVSAETMAEISVELGQILRKHGVPCRYNEDFNYLQHSLVDGFFREWRDIPVESRSGSYDYWEAVHEKLGISRKDP
jgi:hypothetical protein